MRPYCSGTQLHEEVVTPAKAGVQEENLSCYWIPAFAGMTELD